MTRTNEELAALGVAAKSSGTLSVSDATHEAHGSSLPEIVAQQNFILGRILESHGELSPELEHAFDQVNLQIAAKVDGYIAIVERFEAEADYWKSKAQYYTKISKSCEMVKEKILGRVKETMLASGLTEIKGIDHRFAISDGGMALDLQHDQIAEEYKTAVVTLSPDRELIQRDLEMGIDVAGASLRKVKRLSRYANTADKREKVKKKKEVSHGKLQHTEGNRATAHQPEGKAVLTGSASADLV